MITLQWELDGSQQREKPHPECWTSLVHDELCHAPCTRDVLSGVPAPRAGLVWCMVYDNPHHAPWTEDVGFCFIANVLVS